MDLTRRSYLGGMGAALGAGMLPETAAAQAKSLPGLPSTMIWSVYDVGASGYVEASAVADALGKVYGTRVRLQPSGTSIGRIQPLKERRVSYGWLATEVFFAAEGLYEYASPNWGPQDLRCLLGRVNALSVVTTKTSGIKTLQDMKGKRYAYAKANTSVNAKVEPILEAAGLSYKDFEIIEFPSYGAIAEGAGRRQGRLRRRRARDGDAARAGSEPVRHQLDRAARIRQGPLGEDPADHPAGLAPQRNVRRRNHQREPEGGHGLSLPDDHRLCRRQGRRGLRASPRRSSTTTNSTSRRRPIMERWEVSKSGAYPMDAPFHDGAIKLLKEKNIWTAEHQKWQDGIVKRQGLLRQGWADMMAKEPAAKGADAAKLLELWTPRRAEILKSL